MSTIRRAVRRNSSKGDKQLSNFSRRDLLNVAGLSIASAAFAPLAYSAEMTHYARIEAALANRPTDRTPLGFWWHWANKDRSPRRLAEMAVRLQQRLDMDFIKFSPYGLYSVVDWGVQLNVRGGSDTPILAESPIEKPDDWLKIKPVRSDAGEYLIVLEAQRIAIEMLGGRVPFVQTVFSPLTSASKIAGPGKFLRYMQDSPQQLHTALAAITETTRSFVERVVAGGADGIFFANQWAGVDLLSPELYDEFSKPYDLQMLEPLKGKTWFNIYHLHAHDINFDSVLDYPVEAFNWHDRDYGPSIAEMRKRTDKCLIGGITPSAGGPLVAGSTADVDREVTDAIQQSGGTGFILGPGEVVDPSAKPENVDQVLKSILSAARS